MSARREDLNSAKALELDGQPYPLTLSRAQHGPAADYRRLAEVQLDYPVADNLLASVIGEQTTENLKHLLPHLNQDSACEK